MRWCGLPCPSMQSRGVSLLACLLCTTIRGNAGQLCTSLLSRGVLLCPRVWSRGVLLTHPTVEMDAYSATVYGMETTVCSPGECITFLLSQDQGSAHPIYHKQGSATFSTVDTLSISPCMLHIDCLTLTPVVLGSRLSSTARRLPRGSVLERVRAPGRSSEI
jgi:hypothetical protein